MNASNSIRAKLIASGLSLVLVFGFTLMDHLATRSAGELAFKISFLIFGGVLVFACIFGNCVLQLLWGWGLAIATPCLLAGCIFFYRGPWLALSLLATLAAGVGAYLLLLDSDLKAHRRKLMAVSDDTSRRAPTPQAPDQPTR